MFPVSADFYSFSSHTQTIYLPSVSGALLPVFSVSSPSSLWMFCSAEMEGEERKVEEGGGRGGAAPVGGAAAWKLIW